MADQQWDRNDVVLEKGYRPLTGGYQPNDNPINPVPPTGGSALSPASAGETDGASSSSSGADSVPVPSTEEG